MAAETTTYEILPPTWTAILPVMLDARSNIRFQLDAPGCVGVEDGWCRVHNNMFEDDRTSCETMRDKEARREWRKRLDEAWRSNNELFQQMAEVANRAVAVQRAIKAYYEASDEPGGTEVDAALISDLAALVGVKP